MTRHEQGSFTGASGGTTSWQSWSPKAPTGLVVLAHGIAEHAGRYAHVAERLVRAGYAVHAPDHEGHGRSSGTRGNVGRMAWVVEDLHRVRRDAEAALPGVPVFVLGHSLGGLIALDYVTSHGQEGLAGLALSGAAVDPSIGSAIERRAAPLLSRLAPNLGVVELDAETISRDPAVVAAYRSDPLVHLGKVRARTGAETLLAVERVSKLLPSLTLPVLVMHGGEDRLADPAGGRMVAESVGSPDVTLRIHEGLWHEIFNEPEQDLVLDELVAWLDAHRG